MNMTGNIWTAALLVAALAAPAAQAALVTELNGTVIGFDDLVVSPAEPYGPVEVGGGTGYSVLASAAGGNLALGEAPFGAWGLGSNGMWSLGKTFAGVDGGVDPLIGAASLTFEFATPVMAVGAFLNYDPDFLTFGIPEIISIAVYDKDGVELEPMSFLPIYTGEDSLNDGAFYGIALSQPVISKFVVYGPYAVVDDLTFAVPEPSTYALLLGGLALLGVVASRRRG